VWSNEESVSQAVKESKGHILSFQDDISKDDVVTRMVLVRTLAKCPNKCADLVWKKAQEVLFRESHQSLRYFPIKLTSIPSLPILVSM